MTNTTTQTVVQDVTEAHEQAHREDERRWARQTAMDAGLGMFSEDTDAIVDLLVRVARNWRLSRETANTSSYQVFSQYATLSGNAARELETEWGFEVALVDGRWVLEVQD